jgi:hypothetical protein
MKLAVVRWPSGPGLKKFLRALIGHMDTGPDARVFSTPASPRPTTSPPICPRIGWRYQSILASLAKDVLSRHRDGLCRAQAITTWTHRVVNDLYYDIVVADSDNVKLINRMANLT